MSPQTLIHAFCALSFWGYGLSCLTSRHMRREFARYGIPQFRALTGALQILAAIGLVIGFGTPLLGSLAAAGLALQMACGLAVRLQIGDPWFKCLPAAAYLITCTWLATQLS